MNNLLLVPVLLPLVCGALLMMAARGSMAMVRLISISSILLLLLCSLYLLPLAAQGEILVYGLGNWSAPFGIVLLLDRLSASLAVSIGRH